MNKEQIGELTHLIFNALPFGCDAADKLRELESLCVQQAEETEGLKDKIISLLDNGEIGLADIVDVFPDALNYKLKGQDNE